MVAYIQPLVAVAGVFTKSSTRSPAVLDCEEKLASIHSSRNVPKKAALLVNSGNANAFTGAIGAQSVKEITHQVSKVFGLEESAVFSSSTGVIGEPLPTQKILPLLVKLKDSLLPSNILVASKSIMTTDTFAKGSCEQVVVNQSPITITSIAKGSGMIAPNMGTMLAYVFTDANIHQDLLSRTVKRINEKTFNSITVDGDTSTSDTVLVFATGEAKNPPMNSEHSEGFPSFKQALSNVMESLARQIVIDGEGATKFIEVSVRGASNEKDAKCVAHSIANSPLVKTAISGEDANWGRIVMAIGKSGALADRDKVKIWFGEHLVAEKGSRSANYNEEELGEYMKEAEISIAVDLGLGSGEQKVWTCDFSHGYISINADYRS